MKENYSLDMALTNGFLANEFLQIIIPVIIR
jgi:hypothetical protein